MSGTVECVWPVGAVLGEGPTWSPVDSTLWFVDIKGHRIHSFNDSHPLTRSYETPEFSAFVFRHARGGMVCGLRSGLYRFDPAGNRFDLIAKAPGSHAAQRLNDGYVDPRGRLWFGTMDNDERDSIGALYRFSRDRLELMDDGYGITNGPAMCPQGRVLYHVDTQCRCVYAFDVDGEGRLSGKRLFVQMEPGIYPDGPTVDSAGNVWVAMFGGWGVRCYSPQGMLLSRIDLPVSQCTKVAFGGADLRTMYITTASIGLSEEERRLQPLAGGLFRTRVGVAGLPPNEFAG